jgi:N-acetylneuraminic acid mutarotase
VLAVSGFGPGYPEDETRAELFDPETNTWTRTGSMSHGRNGHTATLLNDGTVLVVGGMFCGRFGCISPPPPSYVPAELYDPSTGRWSRTGDLIRYRQFHTATRLDDGRVLIAGGVPGCGAPSAEIFDPLNGTWTRAGDMLQCGFGTATLLADGTVLAVGGAVANLYDPGTDSWRPAGSLTDARSGHTATRLVNGNVLVVGGAVGCFAVDAADQLNTSEEYDPVTGTWGSRMFLQRGRQNHSATLLLAGRVLVAGGITQLLRHPDGIECLIEVPTETTETYAP